MNSKIESTLPKEVRTILDRSFKSQSFVPHNYQRNSSSTNANSNETRQSGMVSGEGKKRRKRKPKKSGSPATPVIMISSTANIATEPLENAEIRQNTAAVPITQQDPTVSTPSLQIPPQPFRSDNRGRGRGRFFGNRGGRGRRGGSKPNNLKVSGENDAYCMEVAPLNIFENQVVPTGLHNFSKIFRPHVATTRVFSLGLKFIPVWKKVTIKKPFAGFNEFRRRMTNKMFFEETSPGIFERNKTFRIKSNNWVDEQYNEIDNFCFKLRDGITNLFEKFPMEIKQNLSNQEFFEIQKIRNLKNKDQVINDSDKNLGAVMADKSDVFSECKRQLYDVNTYIKLSLEEMEILIAKIKSELSEVVGRYNSNNLCSAKEKDFLLSKMTNFTVPHFYIIWKILKNPIVGRPIVAGYNWILTPASIFVGHYLKKFIPNSIPS